MNKNNKVIQNQIDSHQSAPWPCLKVLSFRDKNTALNGSKSSMAVNEYTIVSDILRATVSQDKNSPLMTAEVLLSSGDYNYISLLFPGDYSFIWINDDMSKFQEISNAALNNKKANGPNSGLKFFGRVNSVREVYQTAPSGMKSLRYLVTFKGFSEFQTQVYYNPSLKPEIQTNNQASKDVFLLSDISKRFQDYFFNNKDQTHLQVEQMIKFFIDTWIGSGPDNTIRVNGSGEPKSPNASLIVPKEVFSIFGEKYQTTYSQLLNRHYGIQSFGNSYHPQITSQLYGNVSAPVDGFNNNTLWDILKQYSNPALNELYTTLRMDKNGQIKPTFVARQIPFTSIYFNDVASKLKLGSEGQSPSFSTTKFLDVPRWIIDPSMILSANLGTSDSARFNFIQVYGNLAGVGLNPQNSMNMQIAMGNYFYDEIDAIRNGSRNLIQQTFVNLLSNSSDNQSVAATNIKIWVSLITDWYINGHYKLTGTIQTAGISSPIAIGDNVQIGTRVLHIESVRHTYEVTPDGKKIFRTELGLSNGVLSNGHYVFDESPNREDNKSELAPGYTDEERYVNDQPVISGSRNRK